jgi:hypothetical protein
VHACIHVRNVLFLHATLTFFTLLYNLSVHFARYLSTDMFNEGSGDQGALDGTIMNITKNEVPMSNRALSLVH